ncbi:MAG: Uma2 family endonuclease [Chloroflexi bacterium]|nr:Uma2 family endonuclease [Chloroflexota bacterium]
MTTKPASRLSLRERPHSRYHGLRMSEEEYLALPEEKPYLEYVDGVVLEKPMPSWANGRVTAEITFRLVEYSRIAGGGAAVEGRVLLAAIRNYRLPDAAFWAPGRRGGDDSVPTLAVEVRSPRQSMNELRAKCRAFRSAGVDACWIIDPERRTAEVFEGDRDADPVGREERLESTFLPGFVLPLAELFAVLDR